MSSTKPIARPRPARSAPPNSPRIEENPGYRRGRAIRSCLECRRRKMRCNRARPCQNCNRFCRDCIYLPFPEWPSGASSSVRVEGNSQSPEQGGGRGVPPFHSDDQHTGLVQPSPFTHHHPQGYGPGTVTRNDEHCDIDADDESLDVALQIGRLSLTPKTGAFFKPHVANQINTLLSQTDPTVGPYTHQNAYGISSTQRLTHPTTSPTLVLVKRILPLEPSPGLLTSAPPSFLAQPGLELPTRDELELLYYQYWSAVDPLAHIIHKSSFEGECRKYLLHSQVIDAAPASFKALILAMCLAAAVSLPILQAKEVLGVTQQTLVDRLKIATEKALANASFMSSVEIQTLQAFTIYLIPQCRAEISKSHTDYVGALIRLAKAAGLDHELSDSKMNPVGCQVRRLLWHQLCFLDFLTTEAQGHQPGIRDGQHDTQMPMNIRDDALDRPNRELVPTSGWTNATFSIIHYECCIIDRLISGQRSAIERGQTDLKTIQHMVSVQITRIERQYLQYIDECIPIQRCAKLVVRLFTARFDAILLHSYSQINVNELQTNIREPLIQSYLTMCECTAVLETDPDLAPWAWYARAHHQYEGSIFLLMEIHRDPYGPYADRINQILDHIFGVTPSMSSKERNRSLLQLLAEEFNKLMQLRRAKTSQIAMSDNGSSSPNDHSSMVKTPDDAPQWNHWHPESMYGHGYRHDLRPVSDDVWWSIPTQHGMLCNSTVPQHDEYVDPQHNDYGYVIGSGPV